jgi:hypothetical protein
MSGELAEWLRSGLQIRRYPLILKGFFHIFFKGTYRERIGIL